MLELRKSEFNEDQEIVPFSNRKHSKVRIAGFFDLMGSEEYSFFCIDFFEVGVFQGVQRVTAEVIKMIRRRENVRKMSVNMAFLGKCEENVS